MDEYNEKTCTTAGELRALGIVIHETVPDVAWVPRYAMRVKYGEMRMVGDTFCADLSITFTHPFRWLRVEMEVAVGSESRAEHEAAIKDLENTPGIEVTDCEFVEVKDDG